MPKVQAQNMSLVAYVKGKQVKAILTMKNGKIKFRFDDGSTSREYAATELVEFDYFKNP